MAVGAIGISNSSSRTAPGPRPISRPRRPCARRPTATRCCWSTPPNAINATLLRKSQLQFPARFRAGRRHRPLSVFHGGQSRFRPRTSPSSSPMRRPIRARSTWGRRRRRPRPRLRRAVPVDDRHQDDPRALSRHGAGADRPDQRPSADGVLHHSVGDRVHQGRAVAGDRGHRRKSGTRACRTSRPLARPCKGFESAQWYGIGVPAGRPPTSSRRSTRRSTPALDDPKFKAQARRARRRTAQDDARRVRQFCAAETEKMGKVIKAAGISVK